MFEDQLAQNVRYVEPSFHAGIIEFLKIPGPEIIAAIREAIPDGLDVRIFMGMARNCYTETLGPVLEASVDWDGLAGIDLHGIEYLPLEDWTPKLWAKARDAGLLTKAHAGEFGPAANVREAIEVMGSHRIQHGVRAIEDPDVVTLLKAHNVTLDMCPISNVKLNVVTDLQSHPIRKFFDQGVRCTISTDDMFSFGNRITDEYAALSAGLDFSQSELAQIAKNGFEVALVEPTQRAAWIAELDAYMKQQVSNT
jgi:adenosine deaminase